MGKIVALSAAFVIAFWTVPMAAQPVAAQSSGAPQAARNLSDFDFVTQKIRTNYAGWDTKVTDSTRPKLDALTATLRAKAATASDSEMLDLLNEWLGFFNDRHVGLAMAGGAAAPVAASSYPSLAIDEAAALAQLRSLGTARDPIEGIWTIDGDAYRVAVLRSPNNPNHFSAIVLSAKSPNWKPGQIKIEFTRRPDGKFNSIYRTGDHVEVRQVSQLTADDQAVSVPGWVNLERQFQAVADPVRLKRMLPPSDLSLEILAPDTALLRIPDFRDNRAQPMRDLIAQHKAELDRFPNWVIDLRENGGGSDYVYAPITPYLYTRPIVTIGMEMRASTDNIALRQAIADSLRADAPDQAKDLDKQNELMRSRIGQYVQTDARPFDIERFDEVRAFPKRVAILIDGAGSSGEQFLLMARQSRKVTLFGQHNSAGVLDFANQVGMPVPSGRYRLAWATSRSLRLPNDPVDPDGIAPDIRIPADVADPVMFAADWLRRQRD